MEVAAARVKSGRTAKGSVLGLGCRAQLPQQVGDGDADKHRGHGYGGRVIPAEAIRALASPVAAA